MFVVLVAKIRETLGLQEEGAVQIINILDEEDDEDEDDAAPAPMEAPAGFTIVLDAPQDAALVPKDPAQAALVDRSILYNWPSAGWCVGVITKANRDGRVKLDGEVVNFCSCS